MAYFKHVIETVPVGELVSSLEERTIKHVVSPSSPAIIAALHLSYFKTPGVAVADPLSGVEDVLLGHDFLKLVLDSRGGVWRALYTTSCGDMLRGLPAVDRDAKLSDLLEKMRESVHGMSAVRMRGGGGAPIILSDVDVAGFLRKNQALRGPGRVAMRYVVSKADKGRGSRLAELIEAVLRSPARRVLLDLDKPRIITSGSIVNYLLEKDNVLRLRDRPEEILGEKTDALLEYGGEPAVLELDTPIDEALDEILDNEIQTVVSPGLDYVATPWNMTVGLYSRLDSIKMNI